MKMFVVIFIAIIFNLLVEYKCQSPCPGFFRYTLDDRTREVFGRIEIPHAPRNVPIQLRVSLSVATLLPTPYVGKIELAKTRQESVRAIETGQPLTYNIFFPLQHPLPLLTEILFNNYQYCLGHRANAPVVTNIFLEHFLYPARVRPGVNAALQNSNNNPVNSFNHKEWENYQFSDENYPITPSFSLPNAQVSSDRPPTAAPEESLVDFNLLNFYQDRNCGKSNVVDHSTANDTWTYPGQWPWHVAVFVARYHMEFQCSGNLITDQHILTAAHCMITNGVEIPANLLLISLGRYRLDHWYEPNAVTREVLEFVIHPEYTNRGSAHADLAILLLRERVQMNRRIKPVCLWSRGTALERVVGRMGYVVGWGKDDNGDQHLGEPRQTRVPIVSQEDCLRSNLKFVRSGSSTSNKTFCAGWRDGSGLCNGDSGSGLIIHDQTTDRYYLRGVLSLSLLDENLRTCDLSSYVVYVDVAKFLKWIHAQIL
ncbi:serine protease gd-like isoform X3 [Diachasmimorpha longicaudata]|uniref:serine protease gd-like isoform X3 n=1 Tax=Diachasmimorpha longicaudata TaxID=58733 RepID=UPI0030B895BE